MDGLASFIAEARKAAPRTGAEIAEALLRWKCKAYAPGYQCHCCGDCTQSAPCGLCKDLEDAAWLINKLMPKPIVLKVCLHGKLREECGPCKPIEPGSQD